MYKYEMELALNPKRVKIRLSHIEDTGGEDKRFLPLDGEAVVNESAMGAVEGLGLFAEFDLRAEVKVGIRATWDDGLSRVLRLVPLSDC